MYQNVKDISLHVSSTGYWPGGNAIFCTLKNYDRTCSRNIITKQQYHIVKKKKTQYFLLDSAS
jgi:hypothetical protein